MYINPIYIVWNIQIYLYVEVWNVCRNTKIQLFTEMVVCMCSINIIGVKLLNKGSYGNYCNFLEGKEIDYPNYRNSFASMLKVFRHRKIF